MLDFNSSSLRFKFIYLTKNVYEGIAIHAIFRRYCSTLIYLISHRASFRFT